MFFASVLFVILVVHLCNEFSSFACKIMRNPGRVSDLVWVSAQYIGSYPHYLDN